MQRVRLYPYPYTYSLSYNRSGTNVDNVKIYEHKNGATGGVMVKLYVQMSPTTLLSTDALAKAIKVQAACQFQNYSFLIYREVPPTIRVKDSPVLK